MFSSAFLYKIVLNFCQVFVYILKSHIDFYMFGAVDLIVL